MFQTIFQRLILFLIFFICFSLPYFSQSTNSEVVQEKKDKEIQPTITLDGFYGQKWGDLFQKTLQEFEAKSKIPELDIKIEQVQQNRLIKIRNRGVQYVYSFYKKPSSIKEYQKKFPKTPYGVMNTFLKNSSDNNNIIENNIVNEVKAKSTQQAQTATVKSAKEEKVDDLNMMPESQLLHVQSMFSSTNSDFIKNILTTKYGEPNRYIEGEAKQGAFIWVFEKGFIIQTTENYHNKAYTKKIIYLSRDVSREMLLELKLYQNIKEEYILKNIIP